MGTISNLCHRGGEEKLKRLVTERENKRMSWNFVTKGREACSVRTKSLLEKIQRINGNILFEEVPCCVFSETEIDFHSRLFRNQEKGAGESDIF